MMAEDYAPPAVLTQAEIEVTAARQKGKERQERQELQAHVYKELFDWLGGDYKRGMRELIPKKGRDRDRSLAGLNRDFARVLDIFAEAPDEVRESYEQKINRSVFDEGNPQAVINCVRNKQSEIRANLVGAISVLTFVDLVRQADETLLEGVTLDQILAPADVDARAKIDLIIRDKRSQVLRVIPLVPGRKV